MSAQAAASALGRTLKPAASALAALALPGQGDGHFLDAAVAQVLGMGVALRTITEDGDLLAGDQVQIGVGVVIDFHWTSFHCPRKATQGQD
jgi:hypothetical protein